MFGEKVATRIAAVVSLSPSQLVSQSLIHCDWAVERTNTRGMTIAWPRICDSPEGRVASGIASFACSLLLVKYGVGYRTGTPVVKNERA